MILVAKVNDETERPDPYPCVPFTDTFNDPPLIITQRAEDRLTLPEGVAYTIEPNQMLRLELHYVNVNTTPQMLEATSTFVPMPTDEVENEANITFDDNPALQTPVWLNTVSLTLPPEAISFEWAGDTRPVASNATEEGRAQNRRVEVEVWYDEVVDKVALEEFLVPHEIKRVKVCRMETVCKLRFLVKKLKILSWVVHAE